ncbi:MAG TPA: HAD family hydrolase [Candidatus Hydrogenedentes bacterium]|nr:HAD family hydrolase [Candidatus Hydrogenedentota bacterium]HPG67607.1 HAD family hydrolase [Candidatus Hydrogenedentota bacterium]
MQHDAVLFDLDGTLLDTLEDLAESVNVMLRSRGFVPHPVDAYRYFVGEGAILLITRALPEEHRDEQTISAALQDFQDAYRDRWYTKTTPYEGIPEMLDELDARGVKKAVLSNKPHRFTVQCVDSLLPEWTFDVVFGQREGVPRKPDPTVALEVAARLGLAPDRVLYVGDSSIDMKTARAAGMVAVGVSWGFRPRAELLENGAQFIIDRPEELIDLLG